MPVRLRLAIVLAVATAVAAALGGWVFVSALSGGLRGSLVAELQTRAGTVSQQLQDAPPGAGFSSPVGPDLADSQPITQVLDRNGAVAASSGLGSNGSLLSNALLAQARRAPVTFEHHLRGAGAASLFLAEPASDGKPYLVVVGASLATIDGAVARVEAEILLGGIIAVLVAGVAAWLLAGAALAPVERMRREAAAISAHDQRASLDVPQTHDELAALAETLNDLLRRLQDALAHQRQFVASAGHELRTPLAILKSELELAGRPGRTRHELASAIDEAAIETDRLVHLAEDLLRLAESEESVDFIRCADADLVALAGAVIAASESRWRAGGVTVRLAAPPALHASADAARIRQAVENVLDNALRFAPEGSLVTIAIRSDGDGAVIEILDEGPGIHPEFVSQAFERFTRPDNGRDRDHGGAGLGLSIVRSIIEAHGGHVEIGNRPGGGTYVSMRVPA
jgi:signal transduction histidine kinase